ncbi:hypothetical protein [uncultured Aquimarina sp.]|uniref:hypothetical protein n=1 Tax=uncultured Aquimarina sp. TaxID=575652 RepID=UPI002622072C|nr:hypothetical protein [uncultured Aquimarina sp.]
MNILKKICFLIHVILFSSSIYGQKTPSHQKAMEMKYGTIIKVKTNETIVFEDNLSITLESFSHKTSLKGITKASANITLNLQQEEILQFLSVYSNDHLKSEKELNSFEYTKTIKQEDGTSVSVTSQNNARFTFWKGYQIQLKKFEYDRFIKIIVTKIL